MSSADAEIITLSDGLKVVYHKVAGAKSTDICLRVNVGSRDEALEFPSGTHHYLEHRFGFGSHKFPEPVRNIIEGYADFDATAHLFKLSSHYDYFQCLANVPRLRTRSTLQVIGAMVSDPLLDTTQHPEKIIVNIERGAEKLKFANLEHRQLTYVGYDRHPRVAPPAGSNKSIAAIDDITLSQFHAHHIHGENTIVAIEGDLEKDEAVKFVRDGFYLPQGIRRPSRSAELGLPIYSGGDVRYHLPILEAIHVALGFKAPVQTEFRAAAAYEMLANLLQGSSRFKHSLFNIMRNEFGTAYEVKVGYLRSLDAGIFTIAYETLPQYARRSLLAVRQTIGDVIDDLDDKAFERIHSIELLNLETYKKGNLFAWRMAEDVALHGHVQPPEYYAEWKRQVSKGDLRKAAVDMLEAGPTFIAIGDTDPDLMPTESEVRDMLSVRRRQPHDLVI